MPRLSWHLTSKRYKGGYVKSVGRAIVEHLAVVVPVTLFVFIFATFDLLASRFGADSRELIGDDHRR